MLEFFHECFLLMVLHFGMLLYTVFKNHDHAKDFWMHQLDTTYSYYKLDLLDYFRGFLGVHTFYFLFN